MKSGSGIDPDGRIPEPVHHGPREDTNAAASPSSPSPPAASSPSPPAAAPVDRPQERVREQAVGCTNGSSSAAAAAAVDRKGKKPAATPSPATSPPGSAGSSPSASPRDSAWPSGAFDSKKVFDQIVRDQRAINEAHLEFAKEAAEKEQVKSSNAKALWSKFKGYFNRKKKIVDRERIKIYSQHVGRQTLPITLVRNYYRVTEDVAIHVDPDAYSSFRPVHGDGECFYRSFIFAYFEQVLERQDTHEEHRLLDTLKRVSTEYTNLGWTCEFWRSYKEMHNCLTVVACHRSFTHCWHKLKFEVYCKVNNPIITTMTLKINLLAKEQRDNITWKNRIAFKKLIKDVMGWKREGRLNSIVSTDSYRKEKLLEFFSTYDTTEDILAFLRLVAAIQICSHEDEYIQIIPGLNENYSLKDWCFVNVIPARTFTDHVMMAALGSALEVPSKVEQLRGAGGAQDIYTGPGVVNVTLLYTGNHYDIIYRRAPPAAESSSQQASQREHPTD